METTEPEEPAEQGRIRRERRRARTSEGLSALLDDRTELSGVSPVADFVVESVRWTA